MLGRFFAPPYIWLAYLIVESLILIVNLIRFIRISLIDKKREDSTEDTIYLFTDGIVEAKDINGDLFKKERMLDALNINPSLSPEELDKVVREKVDEFVGDAEQFDDITSLCLRYYGKNS